VMMGMGSEAGGMVWEDSAVTSELDCKWWDVAGFQRMLLVMTINDGRLGWKGQW